MLAGKGSCKRRDLLQRAMNDGAQRARVHLRDGFIHRHHAAHVQRGFGVFIVLGEQFELGMQHGELAGVVVELDFSEKRQAPAGLESFRQILAVKPLGVSARRARNR